MFSPKKQGIPGAKRRKSFEDVLTRENWDSGKLVYLREENLVLGSLNYANTSNIRSAKRGRDPLLPSLSGWPGQC